MGRKNSRFSPWMTPEHPVLTARGWVAAGDVRVGHDQITHLGKTCPTCQQSFANIKHPQVEYCSSQCVIKPGTNQYTNPETRAAAIARTAEKTRQRMQSMTVEQRRALTANGRAVMSVRGCDHLLEYKSAIAKINALKNYQPSSDERSIAALLDALGCDTKLQLRVPSNLKDSWGRKRYWCR